MMRIVFDLEALQYTSSLASFGRAVTLINRLAGMQDEPLRLAVNAAAPGSLDMVERLGNALETTVCNKHIHLYDTWEKGAPEGDVLRSLFLGSLGADVWLRYVDGSGVGDSGVVDGNAPSPPVTARGERDWFDIALVDNHVAPGVDTLDTETINRIAGGADGVIVTARPAEGSLADNVQVLENAGDAQAVADAIMAACRERAADLAQPAGASAKPVAARLRLAYVSPLPPARSGIANYSAELIPALARHYNITLVTDEPESVDAPALTDFPVIGIDAFRAQAHTYARVLYHFGNSPFHGYMFALLDEHPGTVVLHDFFLLDAIKWVDHHAQLQPGLYLRALYESHGYPALISHAQQGDAHVVNAFPASRRVIEQARGLIVHSEHARALTRQWYGNAAARDVYQVAHLRLPPPPSERRRARQHLKLDEEALIITTFGGITDNKCPLELAEAFLASALATRPDVYLIFVGAISDSLFGATFERRLIETRGTANIHVTGYVDNATYEEYLQAADIAVQLRKNSRGETSGAVVDAMAHGLPLIANAHGSNSELPEGAVCLLDDAFTLHALVQALEQLADDGTARQKLGEAARRHVQQHYDPSVIAGQYRDAIDAGHDSSRWTRYDRAIRHLGAMPPRRSDGQMARLAQAIAVDTPAVQPPRLFLDMTALTITDLRTGIERVTRNLANYFLACSPHGARVEPIRWHEGRFYLAREFTAHLLGLEAPPGPDVPIDVQPGDTYLSLEWSPPVLAEASEAMRWMRARGVAMYFIVFDLLPLDFPHYFPADTEGQARAWFEAVVRVADGVCCISRAVADDVKARLALRPAAEPRPRVGYFHLGADFSGEPALTSITDAGLRLQDERVLSRLEEEGRPVLLMVGTLEPRKGHRQVLEALDILWARGERVHLVIAGKQGWKMDEVAERLRRHPQAGHLLHWVEGGSDAMIERLYRRASALVAASEGEGFGLPLIEAAHHHVPVIARDIPVFREVAGEHADYFRAADAEGLADELQAWLRRFAEGRVQETSSMPWLTWTQSARALESWIFDSNSAPVADAAPPAATGEHA